MAQNIQQHGQHFLELNKPPPLSCRRDQKASHACLYRFPSCKIVLAPRHTMTDSCQSDLPVLPKPKEMVGESKRRHRGERSSLEKGSRGKMESAGGH